MPENFPQKIFFLPVIAVASLVIGISLFAKLGPGIPLSIVTTTKTDLFTVTGEGKATGIPDIAQISIGITATGNTVTQAQSQANAVINKISDEVKRLGVGEKDIQTTSYNLRPEYDFMSGRQSIKGYIADINLTIKARQFDKINQIIDTATANGANQVGGLSFTLDDATQEKLENQARREAINKAKQKAAEIARESGLTLGRIINVSENPANTPRPIYAMAEKAAGAPSEPTQVQPGSSEIIISIVLSYETR